MNTYQIKIRSRKKWYAVDSFVTASSKLIAIKLAAERFPNIWVSLIAHKAEQAVDLEVLGSLIMKVKLKTKL